MDAANLYGKYRISKASGEPIDPSAQYFVLRIDTDAAARMALLVYANEIKDAQFAHQLRSWLAVYTDNGRRVMDVRLLLDIYMKLSEWGVHDLIKGYDRNELDRVDVRLENAILESGGELPSQD